MPINGSGIERGCNPLTVNPNKNIRLSFLKSNIFQEVAISRSAHEISLDHFGWQIESTGVALSVYLYTVVATLFLVTVMLPSINS